MSAIPPAVQSVIDARSQATRQQIDVAVTRKSLDAQQQAGDAINQMLEQSVMISRQIAEGHLDAKF